jgi:ADP-ribosyl-[dinitrogen reductase] hydrolase
MCRIIHAGLHGDVTIPAGETQGSELAPALECVRTATDFCNAIDNAATADLPVIGALAGLRWGPSLIPATWATTLHGRVGERSYTVRQLRRLAERLLGEDAPVPPEPRRSLGPREVAPDLWLSNLHAVPRFLAAHPEGAVISLCPTTGAFDGHPHRREFVLHDAGGSKVNPHLSATVDDVLATINAFHREQRAVLVHCHHGASRTGLILRAWLIAELGLSADDATTEAQVRWPKTSTWNRAFGAEIARRAASNA